MKRYVTLKCSVCERSKDSLIDLTHYTPDRCTITLSCEGRLSPVGYTSDGSKLLGVPPSGLSNWYPRGSTVTGTAQPIGDSLYNTSTGAKKQLVLALSDVGVGFTPSTAAQIVLNLLVEQQTAKDYRQYVYRRSGSVTVVNGVESGAGKKVLRYNITGVNPDEVEVYVDGVKRSQGLAVDQYQLYDGSISSPVPPNSVLFNSPVTGTNLQIDIIVTKAATLSTTTLTFERMEDDESRAGTGAWEGIDAVSSPALTGEWSLFYCDFSEVTPGAIDVKLKLNPDVPCTITDGGPALAINPTHMSLLLSRTEVYTQLDRQRAKWVPLTKLDGTGYLITKLIDKVRHMFVTEASAVDLFPALNVKRFNDPSLQRTSLTGNDDSAQLENNIISGPDA